MLVPTVKNYYLYQFLRTSDIGRAAGGENPFTAGSMDNTAAKVNIVFTADYSARRGPAGRLAVIRITAGYLETVDEGPDGE